LDVKPSNPFQEPITMLKQIYIIFLASCALLTWLFRYDIETTGQLHAYRLDRWSGDVAFVRGTLIEQSEPPAPVKQGGLLSDKDVFVFEK
jgi:hypothetical protein